MFWNFQIIDNTLFSARIALTNARQLHLEVQKENNFRTWSGRESKYLRQNTAHSNFFSWRLYQREKELREIATVSVFPAA